jgi:hypothetical protein
MSFTTSFVAVPGSRDQFRREFLDIWKRFRIEESSAELSTRDDLYAWSESRSGHLKGKHPSDVIAFAQDGRWAVVIELSLVLFDDAEQLALLSERFGSAVAIATQGTSGFAGFRLYEAGNLRREIIGDDGKITTVGAPIAAEQGINASEQFYLPEVCALQKALGFSFDLTDRVPGPFSAVHVVDTTVYSQSDAKSKKRSWWKFW